MTTRLDPRVIVPLHEIRDFDKLHDLRRSMEADGWRGRPLLVMMINAEYQALTGTHRLEAAIQAGLDEVPVVVIDPWSSLEPFSCYNYGDLEDGLLNGNDVERMLWLTCWGYNEAAQLMLLEVP